MEAIIYDLVGYIGDELKKLPNWSNVYSLAYHNKDNKLQLYPTPNNPQPSQYVGVQDIMGTYAYIREFEEQVRGRSEFVDGYGGCNYVEVISKRLRAVAVSSNLKNLPSQLSTALYLDLFKVKLNKYTNYTLDNLRMELVGTVTNFEKLVEEEIREDVGGCNVSIGAVDFELTFWYAPKCNTDNIELCI